MGIKIVGGVRNDGNDVVVLSADERQRLDGLRIAFREQLQRWMERVSEGVAYSPAVARVLCESLIEPAIILFLSSTGAELGDEDQVDERAEAIFDKLMLVLEAEVAS